MGISVREMDDVDWEAEWVVMGLLETFRNLHLIDSKLLAKTDAYIDFEWEPEGCTASTDHY